MGTTLLLSPDPRTNHPFTVTLTIEGTDTEGNPFAIVGDAYDIMCLTEGKILFDEHMRFIESVDAATNHRAEILFVARDGFTSPGEFTIACSKVSDLRVRAEMVARVTAANPALTLAPTTPSTPAAITALPVIKTSDPVAIPGIPLIGDPPPKATVIVNLPEAEPPAAPEPITPTVATTTAVLNPPIRSTHTPPLQFTHPIAWAIIILVFGLFWMTSYYFTQKPQVVPVSTVKQSDVSGATSKPDAEDTSKTKATDNMSLKRPDTRPSPTKPKPDNPSPTDQPAPAVRCGACP